MQQETLQAQQEVLQAVEESPQVEAPWMPEPSVMALVATCGPPWTPADSGPSCKTGGMLSR